MSENGFKDLAITSFYSTTGDEIVTKFIEPVLGKSIAFDRLTGYFSVHSIVSVAHGLQGLFANNGSMRLVIGIHDVPAELISAMSLGQLLPEDLVAKYKNRLLSEIELLRDEAQKSAISGLAWLMRLGILEVKVAAPRTSRGIYHQKRMIFRDILGNVIAGTGSLNETMGSRENVEEMQFNLSWQSGFSGVDLLVQSFEEIWANEAEEVSVFDLDEEFATKLLLKTGNPANPYIVSDATETVEASEVLELARSGIAFTPFNLSSAVLYPHQERVFAEALSRWPVRVLMADEVGLGKTLEAGTAISYLHKFHQIKDITILVPAGLIRQWQEELWKHFELDFWRWDSGNSAYVSSLGESTGNSFAGSHGNKTPRLKIVSAQWARMKPHEFTKLQPELLVVDEAHAARVSETKYGTSSTQLWKLINEMSTKVPHLILLTATPMQVHPSEYHGLLALLGLPEEWRDFQNYEDSLRIIAGSNEKPTLQRSATLANLIVSSVESNDWMPAYLSQEEMLQIMNLREKSSQSLLEGAKYVMAAFQAFRTILIKVHPSEYHGLLALLGLPEEWRDFQNYEDSLRIIAGSNEKPTLQRSATLANLIVSSVESNDWMPAYLSQEEMLQIMNLREKSSQSLLEGAKYVMAAFQAFRTILIKLHPGHFFTCRNTKSGLQQFGYVFPNRRFSAPEIVMPQNLNRFESGIENYLSGFYGKTEEALVPKSKFPIAFAKSSYYQRLVSSLYAANQSLHRRRAKILAISDSINTSGFDLGLAQLSDIMQEEDSVLESSFYDDLDSKLSLLNDSEIERVQVNARQELLHINQLLAILNAEGEDLPSIDPKFSAVMSELELLLKQGPVLVFSRYTDTLKGFLTLFEKSAMAAKINGYSLYTGGEVWIKTAAGVYKATKTDVTDALDEHQISVVFCSDAASEGLNLQSAQSIINIDVPWNPARLEQRIGRIARLGQKAATVNIVNVWYPNSIEAKMYTKLLERKDDYELAVGEFPDIFSDSIRDEVAELLNPGNPITSNLAADLVNLRQDFQTIALKEIWESEFIDYPASREMRQDFVEYTHSVLGKSNSIEAFSAISNVPGNRNSIGLNHEALDVAANYPISVDITLKQDLFAAYIGDKFIAFAVSKDSDVYRLLRPLSVGKLLRTIAGNNCLTIEDLGSEFGAAGAELHLRQFLQNLPNIPHHLLAKTLFESAPSVPEITGVVSFNKLGKIGGSN